MDLVKKKIKNSFIKRFIKVEFVLFSCEEQKNDFGTYHVQSVSSISRL